MIEFKKEISVKEGLRFELETSVFSVRLYKGETDNVSLECKFQSNNESLPPEDLFIIKYDEGSNVLKIRENSLDMMDKISEAVLSIGLPSVSEIDLRNDNGAVALQDLESDIRIENRNGQVLVAKCEGSLTMVNDNGSIKLKKFDGKAEMKSVNGSIETFSGKGSLKIETGNGQIRILESGHNQAEIRSSNGSIFYDLWEVDKGSFKIRSVNGKIHLNIPQELSFRLQARNENGGFHIGLPDNYETERDNHTRIVKMVRGAGKTEIDIENFNGSINVLSGKSAGTGRSFPGDGNWEDMMGKFFEGLDSIPDSKFMDKIRFKIMKKMQKKGFGPGNFPGGFGKGFRHHFDDDDHEQYAGKEPNDDKDMDDIMQEEPNTGSNNEREEFRQKIFKMLELGTITAEEAEELIKTIEGE